MSQRQAKYITTQAFPEPNYTQTPNDFFEMLPTMEHSEIAVTLVMIRNTFGFHRTSFKMGIGKLADAAGISRNSAKTGAEAAELRGTFRRTNPDEQTEAEWELVVGQPLTPPNDCIGDGQPLTPPLSTIDSQVGVKESIKKENKPDFIDYQIQIAKEANAITEAQNAFEASFGFGALNWDSRPEWRKFSKWVVAEYQRDPSAFSKYVEWRNDAGKYKGMMTNPAIRRDPQIFMDTGWPTFLAHTSMYSQPKSRSFAL